jgi:hypothetical protein
MSIRGCTAGYRRWLLVKSGRERHSFVSSDARKTVNATLMTSAFVRAIERPNNLALATGHRVSIFNHMRGAQLAVLGRESCRVAAYITNAWLPMFQILVFANNTSFGMNFRISLTFRKLLKIDCAKMARNAGK